MNTAELGFLALKSGDHQEAVNIFKRALEQRKEAVAYFVFGPSRVLVLGPDSSVSPLIFAAITPLLAGGDPATAIALAGMHCTKPRPGITARSPHAAASRCVPVSGAC